MKSVFTAEILRIIYEDKTTLVFCMRDIANAAATLKLCDTWQNIPFCPVLVWKSDNDLDLNSGVKFDYALNWWNETATEEDKKQIVEFLINKHG